VMESGVMEWLEENLKAVVDWVDEMNRRGTLKEWAQDMADWVVNLGQDIKDFILDSIERWDEWEESIYWALQDARIYFDEFMGAMKKTGEYAKRLWDTYWSLPDWIKEVGLAGALLGGIKGKVVLGGILHLIQSIGNSIEGFKAMSVGRLGFSEFATMNAGELQKWLDARNQNTSTPESTSETTRNYQTGTGPAGLPHTGLFYGHKGEIVKNPAESEAERRGGDENHFHLHVQYMTGDRESIGRAFRDLNNHAQRVGLKGA